MAKNRKNESAAVRFGPALKAALLCLLIGSSAVGYVWQKTQIYELAKEIRQREVRLDALLLANKKSRDQLAILRSPQNLERRIGPRELNLGLGPPQPSQIWRLTEPAESKPAPRSATQLYADQRSGMNEHPE